MKRTHKACLLALSLVMLAGGATRSVAAPAPARSANGATISANSGGVIVALHVNF